MKDGNFDLYRPLLGPRSRRATGSTKPPTKTYLADGASPRACRLEGARAARPDVISLPCKAQLLFLVSRSSEADSVKATSAVHRLA